MSALPHVRSTLAAEALKRKRGGSAAGLCLLAALSHGSAMAQLRPIEAAVNTTITAMNNGAGALTGQEESDVILAVQPTIRVERRSAGLTLTGHAGASLVTSANKTRRDRVLPEAALNADATLVDRLLSLQAGLDVRQLEEDPFAARVDPSSTENAVTSAAYRISPVLSHEFSRISPSRWRRPHPSPSPPL